MIIFDAESKPVIFNDLFGPVVSTHFWVLDLHDRDFCLSPLNYLEELTCSTISLDADGFVFNVPANWYILLYDKETAKIDNIQVGDISNGDFTAFTCGHKAKPNAIPIRAVDYVSSFTHIVPHINKHQMLCHAIDADRWVCLARSDNYNRVFKHIAVGDLFY